MSGNKITFDKLFDKDSLSGGITEVVGFIKLITQEIDSAKVSANALTTALGASLKTEIAQLSSLSKTLSTDVSQVNTKMTEFRTTVAGLNDTVKKYEKENENLKKQLEDLQTKTKGYEDEQKKLNKAQSAGGITANGLAQSLLGVASGAALLYKGISMLKDQLKKAVDSTINFEKAMKEVQAISRASGQELQLLVENANRLGATTEKTATQIASLQKELAKLGFNTTDILASTDAIVDLSTATGEGLAESATIAAATLRAFGLETVEMSRVVDVMAGSFVRSGLDLEKFRESMKLVAPIARAANLDIEITTASLSKLADAGLSGSLAGTALRNLFSNMADPTSKLGERLGFAVTNSEELVAAFRKLKNEGVDLAEAVQLVDVRARPAFFTLLNQIDAVEGLATEYAILNGEAKDIADTMRDSLANDIEIANSAFDAMRRNIAESFVPAMREAAQGAATLSEFIRFLNKDLTEYSEKLERNTTKGEEEISMFNTLINVVKLYRDTVSDYVESSKLVEHFQSVKMNIEEAGKAMSLVSDDIEAFEAIEAIIKSTREGADGISLTNVTKLVKTLGDEYSDIALYIERGNSLEKAGLAVRTRLLKNLENSENIYKQQEDKLQGINRQISQIEIKTKKTVEEEEKLNVLRADAGFLTQFIYKNQEKSVKIQELLNKLKVEVGSITEDTDAQLTLNKITRDYNVELAKTAEIKAKERFERTNDIDDLNRLKEAKRAVAKSMLNDQIEAIKASQDADELKSVKMLIAYEKHKQEVFKIEQDTIKSIMKLNEEWAKAEEEHFEKMSDRIDKWREKAVKAYGDSIIEIKNIVKEPPVNEEAWVSMSNAIENFKNKSGGALKEYIQLKKDLKALKQKGADQDDVLNAKDAEHLVEMLGKLKEFEAVGKQLITQGLREISNGVSLLFDNAQQRRQNELTDLDKWEQERIAMAGDNEEAINAIKEQAEEKRKKIKIEQAKADKREAIFQIGINTAVNLVRAFPNAIAMALAGALGLAQTAIVMAKPLPQFYKGTDNSPEGLAVVGDRHGRELIRDGKTGQVSLSPDKATVVHLSKGSQVIPNHITEKMLSNHDHNGIALRNSGVPIRQKEEQFNYNEMGNQFERALTKMPVSTTNFDENGVKTFVRKGNNRTERLNKRYKF